MIKIFIKHDIMTLNTLPQEKIDKSCFYSLVLLFHVSDKTFILNSKHVVNFLFEDAAFV